MYFVPLYPSNSFFRGREAFEANLNRILKQGYVAFQLVVAAFVQVVYLSFYFNNFNQIWEKRTMNLGHKLI